MKKKIKSAVFKPESKAAFDEVTGAATLPVLFEVLNLAIHRSRRLNQRFAILNIDINQLCNVNANFGRDAGDKLLKKISDFLKGMCRKMDFVARVGEDEFIVLLDNIPSQAEISIVVKRILEFCKKPLCIDRKKIGVTIGIGISTFPDTGVTREGLLDKAALALGRAKEIGGSIYIFYTKLISPDKERVSTIEVNLRKAVKDRELFLLFQPIINTDKNSIKSFEVLLRWKSKVLGLIDPGLFIPIAEEKGFMYEIGQWVLNEAFAQYAEWIKLYPKLKIPKMSLNCSVEQIKNKGFLSDLRKLLKKHKINNKDIILEITETMILEDEPFFDQQLKAIKDEQIDLAMDDFGTGYSSMSHIKRVPIAYIKIDKSFISNIIFDASDEAVVSSIIHLGGRLNIGVVAEGVETSEQLEYLKERGCNLIQGYFYAKPLPAHDFIEFIKGFSC